MNINDFNSKVNLPKVVSKLGLNVNDFNFVRLPIFGWYAKEKRGNFIGNIFDFFEGPQWKTLYSTILNDFEDCLDFKLPRSEYAETSLFKNQYLHMQYQSAWLLAREEVSNHRARHGDKVMYFKDILQAAGMPGFLENEIGYLTENVVKAFPKLNLGAKQKYKKILVIPSFCTPKHICSFELAKFQTPHEREKIHINGETGWYGKINTTVVGDFNELKAAPGFTWNYKADYWLDAPVELSPAVKANQLIQIWSEVKNYGFREEPIAKLAGMQGTDSVEHHISNLNHKQIQELEKKTERSLMRYWIEAREQQFAVRGKTFVRRGTAYFVIKNNEEEQLTNFVLEIKEIRKRKEDFYWCGFIYHNESIVPFEMADKDFASNYRFARSVRGLFLNLGLGVPFLSEKYVGQLLSLIQLAAYKVQIVPEEEPASVSEAGSRPQDQSDSGRPALVEPVTLDAQGVRV